MSYKPKALTVSEGGTGVATATAYSVLFGGTTSTGALQSISVGSSGDVLLSNGAGALPSFQSGGSSSLTVNLSSADIFATVADSTTYYSGNKNSFTTTQTAANTWIFIPQNCTLNAFYGKLTIAGTLASNENVTIAIRVNNTTDTNLTTTSQWTANPTNLSFTSIGLALTAGDYIQIKIVTPVWGTNPTNVSTSFSMEFI